MNNGRVSLKEMKTKKKATVKNGDITTGLFLNAL